MPTIKRFITTLLIALLIVSGALAQNPSPQNAAQDVLIIIQQEKVRFTAQKAVQEMGLQSLTERARRNARQPRRMAWK